MRRIYYVSWHTKISVGATYYEGILKVVEDSSEKAGKYAQRTIGLSFPEYPLTHIVIKDVSTTAPQSQEGGAK